MAIEEPNYEVVQQLDGAEVRQYAPRSWRRCWQTGPQTVPATRRFPSGPLRFGKNKGARKLEMTQAAVPVMLDMTAPEAALRAATLRWAGEPTLSRYNSPFTPWFQTRNEIWLTLQTPAAGNGSE